MQVENINSYTLVNDQLLMLRKLYIHAISNFSFSFIFVSFFLFFFLIIYYCIHPISIFFVALLSFNGCLLLFIIILGGNIPLEVDLLSPLSPEENRGKLRVRTNKVS